jgi:hypothetical protein
LLPYLYFGWGLAWLPAEKKEMLERVQAVSTNLDTPSVTASIIWTIQNPQENPANSPNYGIDTSMTGILTDEMLFDGQLGFWSGRTGIREIPSHRGHGGRCRSARKAVEWSVIFPRQLSSTPLASKSVYRVVNSHLSTTWAGVNSNHRRRKPVDLQRIAKHRSESASWSRLI